MPYMTLAVSSLLGKFWGYSQGQYDCPCDPFVANRLVFGISEGGQVGVSSCSRPHLLEFYTPRPPLS